MAEDAHKLGGKEPNQYVLGNDFVKMNGIISIDANSTGTFLFQYPDGLSRENCIEIYTGIRISTGSRGFASGYEDDKLISSTLCTASRTIEFKEEGIEFRYANTTGSQKEYEYKIILLKL